MPILESSSAQESEICQFRVRVNADLYQEINAYLSWAGLSSMNDFFSKASQYILRTDKEWCAIKKNDRFYFHKLHQPIIEFAIAQNAKQILHIQKPRLEIFKNLDDAQKVKFDQLMKIIINSHPINDARIFLEPVINLFFDELDISHSGTCVFLYEKKIERRTEEFMVACIYPY